MWYHAWRCVADVRVVDMHLPFFFLSPHPYVPQAINNFIRDIGITRNAGSVHLHLLDHHVRSDLDATAPRQLAVLRPLRVVIENFPEDRVEEVQAKVFPGRSKETYGVPFSRVLFIEETDFRESDSKDYYGLAPNKSIMLRCGVAMWEACVAGNAHRKKKKGIVCLVYTKDSSYARVCHRET